MKKADEDLIAKIRERYKRAYEAEDTNRLLAEDDMSFLAGNQWPESIRAERDSDDRPTLVVNRLPVLVNQATAAARRSNLGVQVIPGEGGDSDVAEVFGGMVRHIEQSSHADQAYDTGHQHAVEGGFGYWRIIADYEGEKSFNQVLRIDRILNPFSVCFDPDCERYDKADSGFVFVSDWVKRDVLEEQYPKADLASFEDGDNTWEADWAKEGGYVRIAEYYVREDESYELALLANGKTVELNDENKGNIDRLGLEIIQTRTTARKKVKWYKICGACVLEGPEDIPSQYLPIIPCTGPEYLFEGEVRYRSLIRDAKDPQRQYNYWQSAITEKIALAPKSPWVGTPRNFEGLEGIWDQANSRNMAYLTFNPDGPHVPTRSTPAAMNVAEIQQSAQAIDDIKATTGIFDDSLGNRQGPEESGVAIMARQQHGNESTFPWQDNLRRSVEHTGRVLVDMIPRVYDTERMVRVLGEDGADKLVRINSVNPATLEPMNMLSAGAYDVVVKAGPSHPTQRAAAASILLQMMNLPQIAPVAAHMLAEQMDFPQAKRMSRMLKRTLPPGVLDPDDEDAQQQQPPPPSPQDQATLQLLQANIAKEQANAIKAQADARKSAASVPGELADAQKTKMETSQLALEIAEKDGTLNSIIDQRVRAAVAELVTPRPMPMRGPPGLPPGF